MSLMRRLNNNQPGSGGAVETPPAGPPTSAFPTPPSREPAGQPGGAQTTSMLKRPAMGGGGAAAPAAATRERNDSFNELKARVQNRLISELDPRMDLANAEEVRRTVEETFQSVLEQEQITLTRVERLRLFEAIAAEILGFGPIEPLLKDDSVS